MNEIFYMKCQKCGLEFDERLIEESHDVPCYIFEGKDRKERKNQADKHGRHNLCKKCHDKYEKMVFAWMTKSLPINLKQAMVESAETFSKIYFNGDYDDKTI